MLWIDDIEKEGIIDEEEYCNDNADYYAFSSIIPEYVDVRFEEAARYVVLLQRACPSVLQRHLAIGYSHACRLLNQLEKAGIVGGDNGQRPRIVLVSDMDKLESIINHVLDTQDLESVKTLPKTSNDLD